MNDAMEIINSHPLCVRLFQRILKDYGFLFDEFGGFVKKCDYKEAPEHDYEHCRIHVNVQGVVVYFESCPREGFDFSEELILPVEDTNNKLNWHRSIKTIIDFIDDAPPPKYEEFIHDHRFRKPSDFKIALQRVIAFYDSPEFAEKSRTFNEWYQRRSKALEESMNEYLRAHRESSS